MFYVDSTPLQEVYFSKTSEILKLQEQLSKVRKSYIGTNKSRFKNANVDQEMIAFNRMVEKQFGFKTFSLTIEAETTYNTYTIPLSYKWDNSTGKRNLIADKRGFKFKESAGYSAVVCMSWGLFSDDRFTDEEIFAIILYEIGHNFSAAITKVGGYFSYACTFINSVSALYFVFTHFWKLSTNVKLLVNTTNGFTTVYNQFIDYLKTNHQDLLNFLYIFHSLVDGLKSIGLNVFGFIGVIFTPFNPLSAPLRKILLTLSQVSPISIFKAIFGYNEESNADNVCAMYGYSAELTIALDKMDRYYGGIKGIEKAAKFDGFGFVYNLTLIPVDILNLILDEHPTHTARIRNNIKYLKNELNKNNLDPKMRKQIESDIMNLEKAYNDIYENITVADDRYCKKAFASFLYKMIGGDIKNLINPDKSRYNDFDKAYDMGVKRGKEKQDSIGPMIDFI